MEVRGQPIGVGYLPSSCVFVGLKLAPSCVFVGLKLGHQSRWQVSLPIESPGCHLICILKWETIHITSFFLRARHNQGLANKAWWTSALPVKYILSLPPTPLAFKTEFYWPTLWPKQALNLGSFCLSLLSGWEGRPTALGMAEESHLWMLQNSATSFTDSGNPHENCSDRYLIFSMMPLEHSIS